MTKVVIIEFDFRAVAKLILEIFTQALGIIDVGPQWRANPVDVPNGNPRLLQAKADGASRKLPAGVFRQRETLLFRRRNQLPVAKQDRAAVMVTVLNPRAYANHIH